MKKLFAFFAALLLLFPVFAQSRKSVSVLGDSYSTFEGFMEPSSNQLWYYAKPKAKQTDVNDVSQTWWHQFISKTACCSKNNSYSGSTVSTTGYQGNDYSERAFITRMKNLRKPRRNPDFPEPPTTPGPVRHSENSTGRTSTEATGRNSALPSLTC